MRYDEWMDQELERRPRKSKPSYLTKVLVRLLFMVATAVIVMWAYKQIAVQAARDLTDISTKAQERILDRVPSKPAQEPIKHDEAIKQFRQQQQAELVRQQKQREIAWNNFFTPAPECLKDATVECANAYIRAKRKFDAEYRD